MSSRAFKTTWVTPAAASPHGQGGLAASGPSNAGFRMYSGEHGRSASLLTATVPSRTTLTPPPQGMPASDTRHHMIDAQGRFVLSPASTSSSPSPRPPSSSIQPPPSLPSPAAYNVPRRPAGAAAPFPRRASDTESALAEPLGRPHMEARRHILPDIPTSSARTGSLRSLSARGPRVEATPDVRPSVSAGLRHLDTTVQGGALEESAWQLPGSRFLPAQVRLSRPDLYRLPPPADDEHEQVMQQAAGLLRRSVDAVAKSYASCAARERSAEDALRYFATETATSLGMLFLLPSALRWDRRVPSVETRRTLDSLRSQVRSKLLHNPAIASDLESVVAESTQRAGGDSSPADALSPHAQEYVRGLLVASQALRNGGQLPQELASTSSPAYAYPHAPEASEPGAVSAGTELDMSRAASARIAQPVPPTHAMLLRHKSYSEHKPIGTVSQMRSPRTRSFHVASGMFGGGPHSATDERSQWLTDAEAFPATSVSSRRLARSSSRRERVPAFTERDAKLLAIYGPAPFRLAQVPDITDQTSHGMTDDASIPAGGTSFRRLRYGVPVRPLPPSPRASEDVAATSFDPPIMESRASRRAANTHDKLAELPAYHLSTAAASEKGALEEPASALARDQSRHSISHSRSLRQLYPVHQGAADSSEYLPETMEAVRHLRDLRRHRALYPEITQPGLAPIALGSVVESAHDMFDRLLRRRGIGAAQERHRPASANLARSSSARNRASRASLGSVGSRGSLHEAAPAMPSGPQPHHRKLTKAHEAHMGILDVDSIMSKHAARPSPPPTSRRVRRRPPRHAGLRSEEPPAHSPDEWETAPKPARDAGGSPERTPSMQASGSSVTIQDYTPHYNVSKPQLRRASSAGGRMNVSAVGTDMPAPQGSAAPDPPEVTSRASALGPEPPRAEMAGAVGPPAIPLLPLPARADAPAAGEGPDRSARTSRSSTGNAEMSLQTALATKKLAKAWQKVPEMYKLDDDMDEYMRGGSSLQGDRGVALRRTFSSVTGMSDRHSPRSAVSLSAQTSRLQSPTSGRRGTPDATTSTPGVTPSTVQSPSQNSPSKRVPKRTMSGFAILSPSARAAQSRADGSRLNSPTTSTSRSAQHQGGDHVGALLVQVSSTADVSGDQPVTAVVIADSSAAPAVRAADTPATPIADDAASNQQEALAQHPQTSSVAEEVAMSSFSAPQASEPSGHASVFFAEHSSTSMGSHGAGGDEISGLMSPTAARNRRSSVQRRTLQQLKAVPVDMEDAAQIAQKLRRHSRGSHPSTPDSTTDAASPPVRAGRAFDAAPPGAVESPTSTAGSTASAEPPYATERLTVSGSEPTAPAQPRPAGGPKRLSIITRSTSHTIPDPGSAGTPPLHGGTPTAAPSTKSGLPPLPQSTRSRASIGSDTSSPGAHGPELAAGTARGALPQSSGQAFPASTALAAHLFSPKAASVMASAASILTPKADDGDDEDAIGTESGASVRQRKRSINSVGSIDSAKGQAVSAGGSAGTFSRPSSRPTRADSDTSTSGAHAAQTAAQLAATLQPNTPLARSAADLMSRIARSTGLQDPADDIIGITGVESSASLLDVSSGSLSTSSPRKSAPRESPTPTSVPGMTDTRPRRLSQLGAGDLLNMDLNLNDSALAQSDTLSTSRTDRSEQGTAIRVSGAELPTALIDHKPTASVAARAGGSTGSAVTTAKPRRTRNSILNAMLFGDALDLGDVSGDDVRDSDASDEDDAPEDELAQAARRALQLRDSRRSVGSQDAAAGDESARSGSTSARAAGSVQPAVDGSTVLTRRLRARSAKRKLKRATRKLHVGDVLTRGRLSDASLPEKLSAGDRMDFFEALRVMRCITHLQRAVRRRLQRVATRAEAECKPPVPASTAATMPRASGVGTRAAATAGGVTRPSSARTRAAADAKGTTTRAAGTVPTQKPAASVPSVSATSKPPARVPSRTGGIPGATRRPSNSSAGRKH